VSMGLQAWSNCGVKFRIADTIKQPTLLGLFLFGAIGNERLQQMMGIMASERGGRVFATDER
jgi:hypothetical protein